MCSTLGPQPVSIWRSSKNSTVWGLIRKWNGFRGDVRRKDYTLTSSLLHRYHGVKSCIAPHAPHHAVGPHHNHQSNSTNQDTTLLKQWKILINFLPLSFISNVFQSWETGWCSLQKWINLKSQAWGRTPLLPTLRGRDRLISENSRPSGLQSEFHSLWAMYRNPFLVFPPKKILPFWKWNWLLRAHKRDTRYMNLNSENPSCSSSIRVFSCCLFRVLNYNNKQNPAINLNAAILQRTWAAIHLKSDSLEEGTTNLDTQT